MNENAKRWVAALRSEEYEQTNGYLRTDEGHCCLGVACEEFRKKHPDAARWEHEEGAKGYDFVVRDKRGTMIDLPHEVQGWLGLTSQGGQYETDRVQIGGTYVRELTDDNDGTGLHDDDDGGAKSFGEIANIIEAEPTGLFEAGETKEEA